MQGIFVCSLKNTSSCADKTRSHTDKTVRWTQSRLMDVVSRFILQNILCSGCRGVPAAVLQGMGGKVGLGISVSCQGPLAWRCACSRDVYSPCQPLFAHPAKHVFGMGRDASRCQQQLKPAAGRREIQWVQQLNMWPMDWTHRAYSLFLGRRGQRGQRFSSLLDLSQPGAGSPMVASARRATGGSAKSPGTEYPAGKSRLDLPKLMAEGLQGGRLPLSPQHASTSTAWCRPHSAVPNPESQRQVCGWMETEAH